MIKRLLALALILTLLTALVGCAKSDEELKDELVPDDVPVVRTEPRARPDVKEGAPNLETKSPAELQAQMQEEIYATAEDAVFNDVTEESKPPKAVGYLVVPGTEIKDWIMWAADNMYFHRKDNWENYSFTGCFYLDQECRLNPVSRNVVIYGHNMNDDQDGTKFGQLLKYRDKSQVEQYPNIFIQTPTGPVVYKIHAVFYTDIYFDYIRARPSVAQRTEWFEEYKSRSLYYADEKLNEEDMLITLSTCTYLYGSREDQRFVVVGRQLRSTETVDTKLTYIENESRKEPEFDLDLPEPGTIEATTPDYDKSKERAG